MRVLTPAMIAALVVSGPAAAQQQEVETLAPVSAWNLDMAQDSCALSRNFGNEEFPVMLQMRQYAPGAPLVTTIVSQRGLNRDMDPDVYFGPASNAAGPQSVLRLELDDGLKGARVQIDPGAGTDGRPFLAQNDTVRDRAEAALEYLFVGDLFENDIRLATGPMQAPMAAMRDCQLSLLEYWGFDPEVQQSLSRDADATNRNEWVDVALRRMPDRLVEASRGKFQYVLFFTDDEGRIASCRALSPGDHQEFAASFCELAVSRGRVAPTLNAAGEGTSGVLVYGLATRTQAEPFYTDN